MKKFAFLIAAFALLGATAQAQYEVGDYATDFRLKDVTGQMVSLADYPQAKGFVVVFTCNHCPYSVLYEDRIIALHSEYAEQGFPVVAINPNDPAVAPDDSFEKMVVRAQEKGFTFPYLFDEGQKIYPQYGATRTPHVFLLANEGQGKYRVAYIGAIDDNAQEPEAVREKYLEEAIQALIAGDQPNPSFTKAIGCSIKASTR